MSEDSAVMLACYEIAPEDRAGFLRLLQDPEQVCRQKAVLGSRPILRLESRERPGAIVEIIEWKGMAALGEVQANERIQAKWSEIKAAWRRGDFPMSEIPEAGEPWAILASLPSAGAHST